MNPSKIKIFTFEKKIIPFNNFYSDRRTVEVYFRFNQKFNGRINGLFIFRLNTKIMRTCETVFLKWIRFDKFEKNIYSEN